MGKLTGYNPIIVGAGYDDSIVAGSDSEYAMVGGSFDWDLVAPAPADVVLPSGLKIKAGRKFLRAGQFMTRITGGAATVATLNNTPTGGTFTLSVTAGGTTATTTALAYNAAASAVQTAIRALANVDPAATVTGSAGGPYTFAFPASMGTTTVTGSGASLTGAGAQPTVTVAASGFGRVGWFGPYDPNAADGRQTPTRSNCGLVERTILWGGFDGLHTRDDVHKGLIVGGHVYKHRLLQVGAGSPTLAGGPTEAVLTAALPTLKFAPRRSYP